MSMKHELSALFHSGYVSTEEACVDINCKNDGSIIITVYDEYARPVMRHSLLDTLQAISRITGKPEVNEGDDIDQRGCETCDYGSRYGFTFHAFGNANDEVSK
jgi:hypothetical protein